MGCRVRGGRYSGEPPVAFTGDILAAARQAGLTRGLYIGCGNGRNYLPLVAGGLDLTGVDISAAAIAQLTARAPDRADRLICGDLAGLPAAAAYPVVIGIQVFQHGDRAAAHAHIRAAQRHLTPGGLFCLRVNATAMLLIMVFPDRPDRAVDPLYVPPPVSVISQWYAAVAGGRDTGRYGWGSG